MANLLLPFFYGTNFLETSDMVQGASLQLHITAECNQRCKHCYMFEAEDYRSQIENPLSKEQIFGLLDEYFDFLGKYNCGGLVALTGGDPLLSPKFWPVLDYLKEKYSSKCGVIILGNPYHIDNDTALRMKKLGVTSYQISLDGLKAKHDYLRKPGSFDDSLRALEILHDAGLDTVVSFTVSKLNAGDLLPLYDFLQEKEYVDAFGFDRLIPTGNGKDMKKYLFAPDEYKRYLFDILMHMLSEEKSLMISMKEQMWRPLLSENGNCAAGCNAGTGTVSVLADGTIYPCRRMAIPAGKYPEKSFEEIFVHNGLTEALRRYNEYAGCTDCPLFLHCRGCPAMKYAVTGNLYDNEPYCWRKENGRQSDIRYR